MGGRGEGEIGGKQTRLVERGLGMRVSGVNGDIIRAVSIRERRFYLHEQTIYLTL
jgi:hypothetical protein